MITCNGRKVGREMRGSKLEKILLLIPSTVPIFLLRWEMLFWESCGWSSFSNCICINFSMTFRNTLLKLLVSFFTFLNTIDPLIVCESEFKGWKFNALSWLLPFYVLFHLGAHALKIVSVLLLQLLGKLWHWYLTAWFLLSHFQPGNLVRECTSLVAVQLLVMSTAI